METVVKNFEKGGVVARKDVAVAGVRNVRRKILVKACIGMAATGILILSEINKQELQREVIQRSQNLLRSSSNGNAFYQFIKKED